MITGIGIDIIEVDRVRKTMTSDPGFAATVFGSTEIEYCEAMANKYQHYAARFCAKEAFLKALGTGLNQGTNLTQIQVTNDAEGKPAIQLEGKVKELSEKFGFSKIFVSLSHLKNVAQAVVVLEK